MEEDISVRRVERLLTGEVKYEWKDAWWNLKEGWPIYLG